LKPSEPEQTVYDRDIFLLVVIIGLALSLNVPGLMALVQKHVPVISSLRIPAYIAALTCGGFVGLFSRRIATRLTAWRDQK
jgi:hypothetical protein